jgi:lysozyme
MKYDSHKLVEMLIADEGMELQVYTDSLDIDTIGVGRNLEDRGLTDEELQHLGYTSLQDVYMNGLTLYGARYLLRNDIAIVEKELCRAHSCVEELDEARQMVCINMAFNLGMPRLNRFKKMWAAIYEGDYGTAALEMLDSKWADQVKGRALRLSNIMKTGTLNG